MRQMSNVISKRKTPCPAHLTNNTNVQQLEEDFPAKTPKTCEMCKKTFSSNQSKCNHKKYYCKQNQENKCNRLADVSEELKIEIFEHIQKQVH